PASSPLQGNQVPASAWLSLPPALVPPSPPSEPPEPVASVDPPEPFEPPKPIGPDTTLEPPGPVGFDTTPELPVFAASSPAAPRPASSSALSLVWVVSIAHATKPETTSQEQRCKR